MPDRVDGAGNTILDPHVQVEVLRDGSWHRGFATAYRGEQVSVRYTVAPGEQYLHWVAAERVRRVDTRP